MWREPVVNRTKESYLNASDLNRIYQNIEWLGERLNQSVTSRAWDMTDLFTVEDGMDLLIDLEKIRSSRYTSPQTPMIPEVPLVIYGQINDIEKILFEVHKLYKRNLENVRYAGEFYTAEMVGVL